MNLDQELDKVSQDIDETREALRRVRGTNDSLEAKYVSLLEVLLKKEDRLIAGTYTNTIAINARQIIH